MKVGWSSSDSLFSEDDCRIIGSRVCDVDGTDVTVSEEGGGGLVAKGLFTTMPCKRGGWPRCLARAESV
jgi:hypothetical protein